MPRFQKCTFTQKQNIFQRSDAQCKMSQGTADLSTDYKHLAILDGIPLAKQYAPQNANHILKEIDDNNSILTVQKQYKRLASQPLHPVTEQKIKN